MANETFNFTEALRTDLPPPVARWQGFPNFNFVGGHVAPETVPVNDLIAASQRALAREGQTLATYSLESGPQGYRPLRDFLATKLKNQAGIVCSADDILLTSGSLQGLELVNQILLAPGDTVIIEEASYGGCISRFQRLGVTPVGIPGDAAGMDMDALSQALEELSQKGVKPKYIYTIPTIQNPTATIMSFARRERLIEIAIAHDVAIFEDECYSDLIWNGMRPPALYAMDPTARTIFIGSFSKSIAPALRVGYVVAPWSILSRLLACKTDAGSGALEQMVLAEYCPAHFEAHVAATNTILEAKLDALISALEENFGIAVEFDKPPGGIFLWVKFPATVDTTRLAAAAATVGLSINPGAEWSIEGDGAKRAARICFANPPVETIRAGIGKLAEICNREFGVPERIANVERGTEVVPRPTP
ncbi:MAG: PLP-dependent aminotransferase family protein [Hyphomicrobiaceae bacterium]